MVTPTRRSYPQAIHIQLEPQAKQTLSKVFDNLQEKLKDPNSPESKALATTIAIAANLQLVEKLAMETQAFMYYQLQMDENDTEAKKDHTSLIHEENNIPPEQLTNATSVLTDDYLAAINAKREELEQQFSEHMAELDKLETDQMVSQINQVATENGIDIPPALAMQIAQETADIYTQRIEQKETILTTLVEKAMKPQPGIASQKKDDIIMEETLRSTRAEASQQLAENLNNPLLKPRLDASYSMQTSILSIGLLTKHLSVLGVSSSTIREMAAQMGVTGNQYMTLKIELKTNRQEAIQRLMDGVRTLQANQANYLTRQSMDQVITSSSSIYSNEGTTPTPFRTKPDPFTK